MPNIDIDNPDKTEKEKELEVALIKQKEALTAVTAELIDKKHEASDLKVQLEEKGKQVIPPTEIDNKINDALKKENEKKAEKNKDTAWNEFTKTHPEFHPDNDTGGLRKAIFNEKYTEFKNEGLVEKEDFLNRFSDVFKVLTEKKSDSSAIHNSISSPNVPGSPAITEVKSVKFNEADMKFITGMGLDPEKIAERIRKARGL